MQAEPNCTIQRENGPGVGPGLGARGGAWAKGTRPVERGGAPALPGGRGWGIGEALVVSRRYNRAIILSSNLRAAEPGARLTCRSTRCDWAPRIQWPASPFAALGPPQRATYNSASLAQGYGAVRRDNLPLGLALDRRRCSVDGSPRPRIAPAGLLVPLRYCFYAECPSGGYVGGR